jgi:hypothetical protein
LQVHGRNVVVAAKLLTSLCHSFVKMQNNYNIILHEKNLLVAYTLAYNAEFAADVLCDK